MELAFDSCTNGCTRLSDSVQDSLEKLAADLRRRLPGTGSISDHQKTIALK